MTMSPDLITQHTVVVDITDDSCWMEHANRLAAEGYAPLTNPALRIGVEHLMATLSRDVYEQRGRARTIAALTTDPETGITEITARARVVFGESLDADDSIPPIEAMTFMEPLHGWPHERASRPISQIAEISRFAIAERCRTPAMRKSGATAWIFGRLYEGCLEAMRRQKAGILYAIMPPYVIRLVVQTAIRVRLIESRFRTEDSAAARFFHEFSVYFQQSAPKLYEFPDAPASI
jgi:hypothetical protein